MHSRACTAHQSLERSSPMPEHDRSKTLQDLEGAGLGQPQFDSHAVTNAHRLYQVPLQEYTVEDLRFMISQQFGIPYLIPIALEHLHADPFVWGDCHPGDLLAAVLLADSRYWITSPQYRAEADAIAQQALTLLPTLEDTDQQFAREALSQAYNIFQRAEYFAQHGRA